MKNILSIILLSSILVSIDAYSYDDKTIIVAGSLQKNINKGDKSPYELKLEREEKVILTINLSDLYTNEKERRRIAYKMLQEDLRNQELWTELKLTSDIDINRSS